jgi:hypothetical protein
MLHFIGSLGGRSRVKCAGVNFERSLAMLKKLAVLAAALAVSAPAFADRGHRDHRYGHYYNAPTHRTVVRHVYHRPAPPPRRVVVVHHVPRPAPVVYHQHAQPHNGAAIVVGAVLGAAILHHVITGH